MADDNGNRPRILRPGDEPPQMSSMSHEQFVDAELGLLRAQVRQLQTAFEGQRQTVNIHHQALSNLTAAVALLQAGTLAGRIRRATLWLSAEYTLWREIVRDRLGIEPSPSIAAARDAEAAQVRDALARADDDPEAMPKP